MGGHIHKSGRIRTVVSSLYQGRFVTRSWIGFAEATFAPTPGVPRTNSDGEPQVKVKADHEQNSDLDEDNKD
jgi:hypothetical protein